MRRQRLLSILLILLSVFFILYNKNQNSYIINDKYVVEQDVIHKIITENIDISMSEYEKVRAVHDYIVNTTDYDHYNLEHDSIPDIDYTAKGVLEKHIGVCRGYAEAFKLLMDELDIECDIITGKAENISHAWNVVKIDNEWYQIDCTFDDPLSKDNAELKTLRYDYFLVTNEQMYLDHIPDSNPYICTSDKYMYQEKLSGVPYHILDSIYQLSTVISYMYDKGENSVTFYFPENALTAESMFNETLPVSLGKIKGVSQFSYTPVNQCGKYYYSTITIS